MDFKPGDKVRGKMTGEELTIVSDPSVPIHRVRYPNGMETFVSADALEVVPAADPRVDVVAEAVAKHAGESDWERTPTYVQEESRTIASAVLAALDAETDGPLIQVGWYCWRGSGHLAAMACKSDSVPIYAPREWESEMREVMDDE